MSIEKFALFFVVFITMSGCSQTTYNLPSGGTRQKFMADQAFCNAQSQAAVGNANGLTELAIFQENKEMCMEGKGYTKTGDVTEDKNFTNCMDNKSAKSDPQRARYCECARDASNQWTDGDMASIAKICLRKVKDTN